MRKNRLTLLFEWLRQHPDALRQVGVRALADAKKASVPVYYMEPAYGNDIIREFPDGRRERIVAGENGTAVPIPPRC